MKKSLFNQINDALDSRNSWAERQRTCYTMRNGGLRRTNKPYPGAPDGWYPLGDTMIEKVKPGYIQQLYGSETITSFVSLRQQEEDMTQAASYWYDYQLKQRSNFERAMFVGIDQMLEQSFTPVKVYYDAHCKRLAFDQVDPLYLIVPQNCQEYNQNGGTDWMVHVLHLSRAEYEANAKFKQGDEFINSIRGEGGQGAGDDKQSSVDLREGINSSKNKSEIVLWEVYNRDRKSHKITVETISPLLPCEADENVVRSPFVLPYSKGIFKGGETFPFFKIRSEIKGKGHYSSRGVIEINAPFEASLTKSWNTLHEWMDFSCRPMYENTGGSPIPNAKNFHTSPGSIMPIGLKLSSPPPAPASLREDMEMTRSVAEDRTQIPDLGASQHLSGQEGSSGKVTATQINAIVGQSGQGNDMRARVFRLDMGEGLKMGWAIAMQYLVNALDENGQPDQSSLTFIVDNEIRTLDPTAVHDDYEITPNGSADSWNKGALVAQRTALWNQFQAHPNFNSGEGVKWVLESVDPRLVKRLYVDSGVIAKREEEKQVIECLEMQEGYGPMVEQADDDKAHLAILDMYAQQKIQKIEMTPELAKLLLQHGTAHMGALKEKKDPMLAQVEAKLKPTAEILAMIASQPGPPPKNLINMEQPGGKPVSLPEIGTPNGSPAAPPQMSVNQTQ